MTKLSKEIEDLEVAVKHHLQILESYKDELARVRQIAVEVQAVELLQALENNRSFHEPLKKASIIKAVCEATGFDFKESKDIVDYALK